jgi:hypothetical protein
MNNHQASSFKFQGSFKRQASTAASVRLSLEVGTLNFPEAWGLMLVVSFR